MSAPGRTLPVWRSMLYVPAHVEKFVASAHTRGADCIQLDLEDSVPLADKERARAAVVSAAHRVRRGGADVIVRINRPLSLAVRDIEASVGPHVDGFSIPKVESASHLQLLDELLSEVELQRGLRVGHSCMVAIIESAAALLDAAAIARASPRLVGLNLGGEDFGLDCGLVPSEETLLLPKQHIVHAASAARILPLGILGSVTQFADEAAFRAMVARSRAFGFTGASAIHPRQVDVLNEMFSPSLDEVTQAQKIVDALEAAERAGRGAVALDGRMIDAPVATSARHLLARHQVIEARKTRSVNV